jgi:hypothetical protein
LSLNTRINGRGLFQSQLLFDLYYIEDKLYTTLQLVLTFFVVFQTGSGVHPASFQMDTGGYFLGGIAAEALTWPLTFI